MSEADYVTREVCDLHHQLTAERIHSLELCDEKLGKRIDGMEGKIDGMLDMQKQQMKFLIYISVGVSIALIGVLVGRGVDFGMLFP